MTRAPRSKHARARRADAADTTSLREHLADALRAKGWHVIEQRRVLQSADAVPEAERRPTLRETYYAWEEWTALSVWSPPARVLVLLLDHDGRDRDKEWPMMYCVEATRSIAEWGLVSERLAWVGARAAKRNIDAFVSEMARFRDPRARPFDGHFG
jgi:hypothetical protein